MKKMFVLCFEDLLTRKLQQEFNRFVDVNTPDSTVHFLEFEPHLDGEETLSIVNLEKFIKKEIGIIEPILIKVY